MFDNNRNKIGNYSKKKIKVFKEKTLVFLKKAYYVYDRLDSAISSSFDIWTDGLFDSYMSLKEKKNEEQVVTLKKDNISAFDKLQPIMSDEDFRRLGLDREENITRMEEFQKGLMMDNFPKEKENRGPVRRLVPKRGIHSRGVFNIWTTILISVLFLGIFIIIALLNY